MGTRQEDTRESKGTHFRSTRVGGCSEIHDLGKSNGFGGSKKDPIKQTAADSSGGFRSLQNAFLALQKLNIRMEGTSTAPTCLHNHPNAEEKGPGVNSRNQTPKSISHYATLTRGFLTGGHTASDAAGG